MQEKIGRLAAVLVVVGLGACGSGGGRTDPDAGGTGSSVVDGELTVDLRSFDGEPRDGGTLRYGLDAEVDGLNPTSSGLSAAGLTMANVVFDTLTTYGTEGEAVPYLAESLGHDATFTTWTVTLRPGIEFHDGTPLDAQAVVTSFETQRQDPLVGLAQRPFYPETDAAEVVDDLTVRFNLLEPDVSFPTSLAGQGGMVASPRWLAAAEADPALNQRPVGTGPFRFDSRTPDSSTRFVRNDGWWGGAVHLDAIEFRPVTDSTTRADLLLSGELDVIHTDDPASSTRIVGEDDLQEVIDETGEEDFVMLNTGRPPFDDLRTRQALALATPLQNYRSLVGLDVEQPADQMFTPDSPYYNPDVEQEGDDPDAAREVADEYCADVPASCTDGRIDMELQFAGPSVTGTRIAELLEEGWSGSFNVSFDERQQDDLITDVAIGDYGAVSWRQFGALDPAGDSVWLMCRTIGAISLNWPRYCDEERDRLILEGQATEDEDARIAAYREMVARIDEAHTYVFLTHSLWTIGAGPDVAGLCDRRSPEGDPLRCTLDGRTWPAAVWLDR
jgi:peptide/nickel transport system substrate-binding protein